MYNCIHNNYATTKRVHQLFKNKATDVMKYCTGLGSQRKTVSIVDTVHLSRCNANGHLIYNALV